MNERNAVGLHLGNAWERAMSHDDDDSLMSLDLVIWSRMIVAVLGLLAKILP
jgi:hypothetical protein